MSNSEKIKKLSQNSTAKIGIATVAAAGALLGVEQTIPASPAPVQEQSASTAEQLAKQQAAQYSETLYTTPKGGITGVTRLKGIVRLHNPQDVGAAVAYESPLLLGVNENAQSEILKSPVSLTVHDGSYIGIKTTNAQNKVVITPVKFDSKQMEFIPDDPLQPTDTIGMYKTEVTGGADSLIGYDPTGNVQLQNPDGSVVYPGFVELNK